MFACVNLSFCFEVACLPCSILHDDQSLHDCMNMKYDHKGSDSYQTIVGL